MIQRPSLAVNPYNLYPNISAFARYASVSEAGIISEERASEMRGNGWLYSSFMYRYCGHYVSSAAY